MKTKFLLIPLVGIAATSCSSINETMRAMEENRQAIEWSTQAINENAQAVEATGRSIDENRRQLEAVTQTLKKAASESQ